MGNHASALTNVNFVTSVTTRINKQELNKTPLKNEMVHYKTYMPDENIATVKTTASKDTSWISSILTTRKFLILIKYKLILIKYKLFTNKRVKAYRFAITHAISCWEVC